jgi:hypothetical protein
MTEQHRAIPEHWQKIEKFLSSCAYDSCLIELRDRVMTMDACLREICEQLDRLKTGHERNWARIVKLEEGPAVAEARGPGSVATGCPQLATDDELDEVYYSAKNIERIQAVRAVYNLGLEHGAAIAKSQRAESEHV